MKAYKVLSVLFISLLFLSCGSFVYKRKIAGDYYLIAVDVTDQLTIYRRLDGGSYIGRVPARVIEYGVSDSLIIAKTNQNGDIKYYIVNMKNDSDYADEPSYLTGPLNEDEYMKDWYRKIKIKLIPVK